MDSLHDGVVEEISFRAALIADEDDFLPAIIELAEVWSKALDVSDVAEHHEEVHRRLCPISGLVRGLPIERTGRHPVEQKHIDVHRLSLEVS